MLLDSSLSALDATVSTHVFNNAISKMSKERTVIMATHQTHLLSSANRIIVMEKGCVVFDGSYVELLQSDLDLTDIEVSYGVVKKADSSPIVVANTAKSPKSTDKKGKLDIAADSNTNVYMDYVRVSHWHLVSDNVCIYILM